MKPVNDSNAFTFGSLFAGIGGFDKAFENSGMKCAWQVEIDSKCQQLLAKQFPHTEVYSDVRKISNRQGKGWRRYQHPATVDLICGGFPCTDVSVAGKRAGLAGSRSGLWFEFARIIGEFLPSWVVIENVPGLLSSNKGQDFHLILDTLEELGYIIDCDVLDSQFFGLAQRRRRVFIVCQHVDHLLNARTTSSALTIVQCFTEILGSFLTEAESRSVTGRRDLDYKNSKDGLMRKIRLFGIAQENQSQKLQQNLDAELAGFQQDGEKSVTEKFGQPAQDTNQIAVDAKSLATAGEMDTANALWNIDTSWSNISAEICRLTKLFITSTETSTITQLEIYTCAKIVVSIAKFIVQSDNSCPTYWSAASSALTVIEEYISYARTASNTFLKGVEWIHAWRDFIREAQQACDAIRSLGNYGCAEVLFEPESVSGSPPPSRGEGHCCPTLLESGAGTSRPGGQGNELGYYVFNATGYEGDGTYSPDGVFRTLSAQGGNLGGGSNGMVVNLGPKVAETLRAQGRKADRVQYDTFVVANTLQTKRRDGIGPDHETLLPAYWDGGQVSDTLDVSVISKQQMMPDKRRFPVVLDSDFGVRRLTPKECERLQGFEDEWTAGFSDTARYKMLGNAVSVPVAEWIGKRIMEVEGKSS